MRIQHHNIFYLFQSLLIHLQYLIFYNLFLEVNGITVKLSTLLLSSLFSTIAKCVLDNSEPIFTPKSTFIISPRLKFGLLYCTLFPSFLNIVDSFSNQFPK